MIGLSKEGLKDVDLIELHGYMEDKRNIIGNSPASYKKYPLNTHTPAGCVSHTERNAELQYVACLEADFFNESRK